MKGFAIDVFQALMLFCLFMILISWAQPNLEGTKLLIVISTIVTFFAECGLLIIEQLNEIIEQLKRLNKKC